MQISKNLFRTIIISIIVPKREKNIKNITFYNTFPSLAAFETNKHISEFLFVSLSEIELPQIDFNKWKAFAKSSFPSPSNPENQTDILSIPFYQLSRQMAGWTVFDFSKGIRERCIGLTQFARCRDQNLPLFTYVFFISFLLAAARDHSSD